MVISVVAHLALEFVHHIFLFLILARQTLLLARQLLDVLFNLSLVLFKIVVQVFDVLQVLVLHLNEHLTVIISFLLSLLRLAYDILQEQFVSSVLRLQLLDLFSLLPS